MVTCEVEMVPHVYFAHCLLLSFLHHFYVGLLLPSLILIAERCAAAASFLCARVLSFCPAHLEVAVASRERQTASDHGSGDVACGLSARMAHPLLPHPRAPAGAF